jgi:preprotein translocase subunit SecG
MHTVLIIAHVFICAGLIGFVLIQHGKGADAGAAFGSGASATVFGSQGAASFLTRTTAALATGFFLTSLTLAYFSGQKIEPKSVVGKEPSAPTTTVPAPPPVNTNELPPTAPAQKDSTAPPSGVIEVPLAPPATPAVPPATPPAEK